jgi:hemolysin type calcium-binding protein/List-Bact-rpt repeat protein
VRLKVVALAVALAGVLPTVAAGASGAVHPSGIGVARLGLGTVVSSPAGISCGAVCQMGFFEGEVVTLTATPDPGQSFVRWRGCEPAIEPRCSLEVWDLECVIAEFTGGGHRPAPNCTAVSTPQAPSRDHPAPGSRCTISGTAGRDVLRGTARSDVICGRGGNDTLYAGADHDLLVGGRGDDRVYGQNGRDYLAAGPGNDVLRGGGSEDEFLGARGRDVLVARDGITDVVHGGLGRDRARLDGFDIRSGVEARF